MEETPLPSHVLCILQGRRLRPQKAKLRNPVTFSLITERALLQTCQALLIQHGPAGNEGFLPTPIPGLITTWWGQGEAGADLQMSPHDLMRAAGLTAWEEAQVPGYPSARTGPHSEVLPEASYLHPPCCERLHCVDNVDLKSVVEVGPSQVVWNQ